MRVAFGSKSRGGGSGYQTRREPRLQHWCLRSRAATDREITPPERVRSLNGALIRRCFDAGRAGPFSRPGSAWPMPIQRCVFHFEVGRTRNPPSDVTLGECRKPLIRLGVVPRPPASPMSNRASRPWTGATRVFRCPVRASRRVGMCTSRTPSAPGRSRPISPCRKATASSDSFVPVLFGDAERPDGQPVGDRVLRRLEAALEPPSRAGIAGAVATRRGRGRGCASTPGLEPVPSPRRGGSLPSTARAARAPRANGAARPKDVAAPADEREGLCASPDGQSAHRPPVSFARSSTALSRSADRRPNQLRRTGPLGEEGSCAGERGSTPAEGRAESVPEAGGTGAEAVATPTAPSPVTTQTRPRNRRLRRAMIGGRQENIRQPAGWTVGQAQGRANSPTANASGAGLFRGIEGGREHPSPAPLYDNG